MSDEEIEATAARLEAAVRVEDARFRIESDLEASDVISNRLVANRVGFLLMASLLLRGANLQDNAVLSDLPQFEPEHCEQICDRLERREIWEDKPEEEPRASSFWGNIGCYGSALVAIFLVVIGLVSVFQWIF